MTPRAPTFLAFALVLILAVITVSLALAIRFPVEHFPTILWACSSNGLTPQACQTGAIDVGWRVVLAYAIASIVWLVATRLRRQSIRSTPIPSKQAPDTAPDETLTALFLCAVLCLLAWDAGQMVFGVAFASRLDEADSRGTIVSFQNLALPLLLQIYLRLRSPWLKSVALATLVNALLLSPYRAMLLSVLGFGFLVPWGADVFAWARSAAAGRRRIRFPLRETLCVAAFAAILLAAGYIDTASRSPTLLAFGAGITIEKPDDVRMARSQPPASALRRPAPRPDAPPGQASPDTTSGPVIEDDALPHGADAFSPPDTSVLARLAQRATFPFYQAVIAGKIIGEGEPPSLLAMVLRKFRLSDAPSLEEFVFRHIYGGEGRNEVTSLTYGEAVAYTPFPPWVWMTILPLLLIATCLWLERWGINAGAIFGMAVWRTSFAGLAPILPSLILQIAGVTALLKLRPRGLATRRAQVMLKFALLVLLGIALSVQAWTLANEWQRRSLLIVRASLDSHCRFGEAEAIPARLETASRAGGTAVRPVLIGHSDQQALLAFPYGRGITSRLRRIPTILASTASCTDPSGNETDATSANIHFNRGWSFPYWPNPLNLLTVALLALALYRTARHKTLAPNAGTDEPAR